MLAHFFPCICLLACIPATFVWRDDTSSITTTFVGTAIPTNHVGTVYFDKSCRLMLPGQILKTLLLKWEKCYWDKFYKDKWCLDQWHWDWSVKESSRYLTLIFFLNHVCNFLFWQGRTKVARTNVAWANITFTVVNCLGGPWKTTL